MAGPWVLDNGVMPYAWGSVDALGTWARVPNPQRVPQAELWIGSHPKSPSRLLGTDTRLDDHLRAHPEALGPEVARRYGALPFLLKVLAAERPLSIQCHPNATQAAAGFEAEQRSGSPLNAPNRNYRDPHPKPELLVALTPFRALEGFRAPEAIDANLAQVGLDALRPAFRAGCRPGLEAWLSLPPAAVRNAARACRGAVEAPLSTVAELVDAFEDDPGVLGPLILNEVRLEPGEGLFLGPGRLHAHLRGVGVEIMGNSDNVLRGGLTPKHVDLPELLKTVLPDPSAPARVKPRPVEGGWLRYLTPTREFELELLDRAEGHGPRHADRAEILFALQQPATLHLGPQSLPVSPPSAVFLPAGSGPYRLETPSMAVRASIPLELDRPEPTG